MKVVINKHDDWCTKYTVHIRKLRDRLGISVKRIGPDIYINEVDGIMALNSMCLAQSAGIRIGDILKAVNSMELHPTTETKTVVEMLSGGGRYVSLCFERRNFKPPASLTQRGEGENSIHPFSKVLLDQEIITHTMAHTVSKQIEFLKERTTCWCGKVSIVLPSLHDSDPSEYISSENKTRTNAAVAANSETIDCRLQLSKVFVDDVTRGPGPNGGMRWTNRSTTSSPPPKEATPKFYCDAMLFSDVNKNNNINQIIDQGVQQAIAASMYIGRASLELLSGQQLHQQQVDEIQTTTTVDTALDAPDSLPAPVGGRNKTKTTIIRDNGLELNDTACDGENMQRGGHIDRPRRQHKGGGDDHYDMDDDKNEVDILLGGHPDNYDKGLEKYSADILMGHPPDSDNRDNRIYDNTMHHAQQQGQSQSQINGLHVYEGLRSGLIIHIEGSKCVRDHIEYIIWVCDVQSGLEWRVSRRFREFNAFHGLIITIRPSLASFIEFPRKRINVTGDQGMHTYTCTYIHMH